MVSEEVEFGRALIHDGGNTMWYALIYVFPESDMAVMVATNRGDEQTAVNVINVLNEIAVDAVAGGDGLIRLGLWGRCRSA